MKIRICLHFNLIVTLLYEPIGQLADLLHILDAGGLPSSNNKYIFNGDFVDRGNYGVEVMCILLALFIARPGDDKSKSNVMHVTSCLRMYFLDCVILNRGNHEDFAICSVYGFQVECYEKYDPQVFGLFVEIFQVIYLLLLKNCMCD